MIPAAALDQHIAILGKTGSGKTYCAKGIVERLLDQQRQVCILDPTSAWYGLRLLADGKSRGYEVVLLGGAHADLPLSPRSGVAIAKLVTEQRANVIIDTGEMTVGEYTRWFIDFAGTLFTTVRSPLHLVIDEAHHFMPQGKVPDIDAGKMLHAGNRLMSGGRSKGIRGMLVTQRPAKLHKDSLTCADTLIAMRVTAPQDRKAYQDWIEGCGDEKQGREVIESLATLQRGEGWVWYPEGGHLERVKFPKIKTYDSSATPKHGVKVTATVGVIDLSEVKAALAEAVKEAEANDPKLLKRRIAELEKQVAAKPAASPDPKAIEKAVSTAIAERDRHWQQQLRTQERTIGDYRGRLGKIGQLAHLNGEATTPIVPPPPVKVERQSPAPSGPPRHRAAPSGSGSDLPKGERIILTVVAQYDDGATREQLTVLTGYKRSSRDAYLQRLRERGLIEMAGDRITANDAGMDALGSDFEPLPTGEALRSYWLGRLPEGERRILECLIDAYPNGLPRDRLSEVTEYKRSSRDAYLQRMKAKRLVDVSGREVKASEELF